MSDVTRDYDFDCDLRLVSGGGTVTTSNTAGTLAAAVVTGGLTLYTSQRTPHILHINTNTIN